MQSTRPLGALITVVGTVGYLVGIATPYLGRAFSITAVMVGITLLAINTGGSAA